MIRVVLDTNIVISGSLWSGVPHQIMQAVERKQIQPIVSEAMLDELKNVLERPKFIDRLALIGKTAEQVVMEYVLTAEIIQAEPLDNTVSADPDDDIFLACAISGGTDVIVSGDPHLLRIGNFQAIRILTATEFLEILTLQDNSSNMTSNDE